MLPETRPLCKDWSLCRRTAVRTAGPGPRSNDLPAQTNHVLRRVATITDRESATLQMCDATGMSRSSNDIGWSLLMTRGLIGFVAVAVLLVTQDAAAGDKDSDAEIVAQIDQLRGIQPGKDATENERINHRLDEIWDRLIARKAQALPVIESTLRKEIEKPSADNFLLLDLGFFLVQEGQRTDDLALDALTKVDPDSRVIQANFKQL